MRKPRIAFYAPLKPPDHPIPSGDREIGRLLMKALSACGYEVTLASRYISYQKRPSPDLFRERRDGGIAEKERLLKHYGNGKAPDLWFTYHPYCKSPDWIGPEVAEKLRIPYVTAEACRTHQATDADWVEARAQVQRSVAGATVNFCLKPSDYEYLRSFMPAMDGVRWLAPFIDADEIISQAARSVRLPFSGRDPVIVAAGMMRPGWKVANYLMLAGSLKKVADVPWNLVIVGDGPAREEIEEAFSFVPADRIFWTGALEKTEVAGALAAGDFFAWPGMHEAIGMIFLEAQIVGLPVAATRSFGVPLVVGDGDTGLLSEPEDIDAYAASLRKLICDTALRKRLGRSAQQHVREKHDVRAATSTLKAELDPLLGISGQSRQAQ
jgi:glycosyltransferase involved in cell wall biosynthesis